MKTKLATEKWKWWHWNNKNIPQTVFISARPTWTLSLSSTINCQCLLHWTKRPGSQIKCWLKAWKYSIPPGLFEEKYLDPPHSSTPPGSTCRVVHLPHSSPCHQVAAGRGYLHSQSLVVAWDKVSLKQTNKQMLVEVEPVEKLEDIGLTCPGT